MDEDEDQSKQSQSVTGGSMKAETDLTRKQSSDMQWFQFKNIVMKEVAELLERSTKRAKDIERDTEKIQRNFKQMEARFENQEYEQQKIS